MSVKCGSNVNSSSVFFPPFLFRPDDFEEIRAGFLTDKEKFLVISEDPKKKAKILQKHLP